MNRVRLSTEHTQTLTIYKKKKKKKEVKILTEAVCAVFVCHKIIWPLPDCSQDVPLQYTQTYTKLHLSWLEKAGISYASATFVRELEFQA